MPIKTEVPGPHAVYPLTSFDTSYDGCGITAGWFVEGLIVIEKLDAALSRLVAKWPLLAGRLEREDPKKRQYNVRIPLGPLPANYEPYTLTSSVSELPIFHYVDLPLPAISNVLPSALFKMEGTPRTNAEWVESQKPLLLWHVTHFTQPGNEYSCVGVTFSHGLLDGTGIASVILALQAEMQGKDWAIPPLPHRGLNENTMETLVTKAAEETAQKGEPLTDYRGVFAAGVWSIIKFLWWHTWQYYWHKVESRMILLPPKVYTTLVNDARSELAAGTKSEVRLSTGDVLAAWLLKTIYSDGTHPDTRVHLTNFASMRAFFDGALSQYPHNCFVPMSYPVITVRELSQMSIASVARLFWEARSTLSISQAIQVHNITKDAAKTGRSVLPYDESADESMTISNMSIMRMVDIDWTGVGAGKTVCRYKAVSAAAPFTFSNLITIAGRTRDGSTVLDIVLNKRRLERLEEEVRRLIQETD